MCKQKFFRYYATEYALHLCRPHKKGLPHSILCDSFFAGTNPLRSAASSPSQALPRQLSRRESQAVTFITKVLEAMRKFLAVLLALPLGELASPTGLD